MSIFAPRIHIFLEALLTSVIKISVQIYKKSRNNPPIKIKYMNTAFQITDDTPVAMLTVGQQKQMIASAVQEAVQAMLGNSGNPPKSINVPEKRYVYGISGIASLFKVSYVTASKLKEGVLKPAVFQQGRKIMCDADLAIDLFRKNSQENK